MFQLINPSTYLNYTRTITPGLAYFDKSINLNYGYCSWKSDINGAIILKWILEKMGPECVN
jgi:hypothetical protein